MISDYNNDKQVAMLSLPSLGFMSLNSKLVKTVTSLIEQLYYEDPKSKNAPHPFVRMKSVEPNEDESEKRRYINTLFIISWIQLIGGLTRANQPWKNIFNFKRLSPLHLLQVRIFQFSLCLGNSVSFIHLSDSYCL